MGMLQEALNSMDSALHLSKEQPCHLQVKAISLQIKECLFHKVDLLQSTPKGNLRCHQCRIPTLPVQELLKEALHRQDNQCSLHLQWVWASSHQQLRVQAYHHLSNNLRLHQWEQEDQGPWLQILRLHREDLKHLLQAA